MKGRMEEIKVPKEKNRPGSDPCRPEEHAEYRSGTGNLHWVTSQTRPDHAVDTSRLQKKQNQPTYDDLKDLVKIIKEVKKTASTRLKIKPIIGILVSAPTLTAVCMVLKVRFWETAILKATTNTRYTVKLDP